MCVFYVNSSLIDFKSGVFFNGLYLRLHNINNLFLTKPMPWVRFHWDVLHILNIENKELFKFTAPMQLLKHSNMYVRVWIYRRYISSLFIYHIR